MFQLQLRSIHQGSVRSRLLTAFQNHSVVSETFQQRKPMADERWKRRNSVAYYRASIPDDAGHSENLEQLLPNEPAEQLVQRIKEQFEIVMSSLCSISRS